MKITDVEAIYPRYRQPLAGWRPHLWQIVVRIKSDAGCVGLGYGGGGAAAVTVVNQHFRELLLDQRIESAQDIEAIWDALYRASLPYGRRGLAIMALSGVDLALWDLWGRAEAMPVYRLLGGEDAGPIRAYATGKDPAWFANLGFTAHKFSHRWTGDPADYARAEEAAADARRWLGDDALLMVDCYMSWNEAVTQEMARRLAPYNIYWFEDVLTPDHLAEQALLRETLKPIRLAGGEHEFTHFGFAEIARSGALDIWQPDVTWCGGITAARRIVDLAGRAGAQVVLHRGGEVWGLHVIAATACEKLAEWVIGDRNTPYDRPWQGEPEPEIVDQCVSVDRAPGFGIALDESML